MGLRGRRLDVRPGLNRTVVCLSRASCFWSMLGAERHCRRKGPASLAVPLR